MSIWSLSPRNQTIKAKASSWQLHSGQMKLYPLTIRNAGEQRRKGTKAKSELTHRKVSTATASDICLSSQSGSCASSLYTSRNLAPGSSRYSCSMISRSGGRISDVTNSQKGTDERREDSGCLSMKSNTSANPAGPFPRIRFPVSNRFRLELPAMTPSINKNRTVHSNETSCVCALAHMLRQSRIEARRSGQGWGAFSSPALAGPCRRTNERAFT